MWQAGRGVIARAVVDHHCPIDYPAACLPHCSGCIPQDTREPKVVATFGQNFCPNDSAFHDWLTRATQKWLSLLSVT